LVLTDLESTNGTRVNGQDCQLRILRFGDIITVGRSMLLFGTHDQINSRVQESLTAVEESRMVRKTDAGDFDLDPSLAESVRALRDLNQPPQLPERLSPSQAAQLAELLEYFHARIGEIVDVVKINEKRPTINVDLATWQLMLQLYGRLSELIRGIADPDFNSPN
jgi:pSer/pThr/pTyr-binding forkhead associated (FHA) protein